MDFFFSKKFLLLPFQFLSGTTFYRCLFAAYTLPLLTLSLDMNLRYWIELFQPILSNAGGA